MERVCVDVERMLDELIDFHRDKLLALARRVIPHLTQDDMLQPCDFPELEQNPLFRYEEGICDGLLTARTAYLRYKRDRELSN